MRLIDDLCATNDADKFNNSDKNIYQPQLKSKVDHKGHHATFLDLDITLRDGKFVYNLFFNKIY